MEPTRWCSAVENEGREREGSTQRQADVWEVQSDPPASAGHRHLRKPSPQAAPGL